jgi:phosphohistidine swiveling domain-containing protein
MVKYINDKSDPWMLAEDIPDIDFHFAQIWLSAFVNDMEGVVGINYSKVLTIFNGYNLVFYYGEQDSDKFAKHVLKKIVDNPKFGDELNNNIRKYSDQLKDKCISISSEWLSDLSNLDLANFLSNLDELHTTLYTYGWLPNAVDMFHGNFTYYLRNELTKFVPKDKVGEKLVMLSSSPEKSILQQEHESFLKLVSLKQNNVTVEDLKDNIKDHLNKYFYLKHLWLGRDGVYDYNYYVGEMDKFIASGEDAKMFLKKEELEFAATIKRREALMNSLKMPDKLKHLFNIYSEFSVTKLYRRDAQIFWAYKMNLVFSEISKRLGISPTQARFMLPNELQICLKQNITDDIKKQLSERECFCVYYVEKGVDILLTGDEARKLSQQINISVDKDVTELNGQTACMGKAKGIVKIVNSPTDMEKMNNGDILVSIATNPDIVPAMKKAAAIVTEQGGITSHAAIVSREMKVPCIIGTKVATKVLKDGDLVEVDGDTGLVKIIKRS